jgi:Tol biopolymer transport system component
MRSWKLLGVRWTLLLILLAMAWPVAGAGGDPRPNPDVELLQFLAAGLEPGPRSEPPLAVLPEGAALENLADWSKLAFASDLEWNWEIYGARGDGASPVRLTNQGASDIFPRYNRGATQIVFVSTRDGNLEVYKMNADGSGQTRLTSTTPYEYWPSWSPDGSKILFHSYRDGDAEIMVMNANGSAQTYLTNNESWDGYPTWSPDGSRIAFISLRSGHYQLWTMNADGSNQQPLTSDVGYAAFLSWSPDGSRIAFNDDFNDDDWLDLAIIQADGTGLVHPLGASPTNYRYLAPIWSPDGEQLAFARVHMINSTTWDYGYIHRLDLSDNSTHLLVNIGFEWWVDWQTLDNVAPTSQVAPLPAWSGATFAVNWSGTDTGGAGLRSYDVQFRDGATGPWTDWLLDTAATGATFSGQDGHTYYFRSRARDNAYNLESYPAGDGDTATAVDAFPPASSASSPPYAVGGSFVVEWSGSDTGSGVASYDVQFRDGPAGVWTDWLLESVQTQASFAGVDGHTYYFRCRARDQRGNLEPYPGGDGDTATVVDLTAPTSAAASPLYAQGPSFMVTWSGSDAASGIASYDVQVRDGPGGVWTDWLLETAASGRVFEGELGHQYYFQSRARDQAGNLESYPGGEGDTQTHTPLYALGGYILGNREQPVGLALPETDPPALNAPRSGPDGAFHLYYNQADAVDLTVTRSGFATLPPMLGLAPAESLQVRLYLPPLDDRVVDGGFEAGDWGAWIASGSMMPVLTSTAHTGSAAAFLGGAAPLSPTLAMSASRPGVPPVGPGGQVGPWSSLLEQEVLLVPALTSGTLSLLYRAEGVVPLSATLAVSLIGPGQSLSVTLPLTVTGWVHRWWPIGSGGPTATLRLEWRQWQQEGAGGVLLDEISLGSVVVGVYPLYLPLVLSSASP